MQRTYPHHNKNAPTQESFLSQSQQTATVIRSHLILKAVIKSKLFPRSFFHSGLLITVFAAVFPFPTCGFLKYCILNDASLA